MPSNLDQRSKLRSPVESVMHHFFFSCLFLSKTSITSYDPQLGRFILFKLLFRNPRASTAPTHALWRFSVVAFRREFTCGGLFRGGPRAPPHPIRRAAVFDSTGINKQPYEISARLHSCASAKPSSSRKKKPESRAFQTGNGTNYRLFPEYSREHRNTRESVFR
ncbi:hypothetical protein EVAR_92100_1 [Eumeta japonica]|uniref:Uncharacterized protein n=1 Tax=Eumeta variegata TaxID=151549 RepID=A0A4C1SYD7_EUMVA|nr:hypothetical protein EVAR_92100_1 [Eumeta japonica]